MSQTSPAPLTIVLATGNPHKVDELRAIFAASPTTSRITVIGLSDLSGPAAPFEEPVEHGTTFAENARIKALSYAAQIRRATGRTDLLCLGDDSGIEIDALGGPPARPGVISSHYSTDGRETGLTREQRDAANNARVLRELADVPPERRNARFVCCMCLARAEQPGESFHHAILHETRGTMEGRIGIPPRVPAGGNGFGYDPLFLVTTPPPPHLPYTRTGAELTSTEKNALSHRGAAARAMVEWINTTTFMQ